MGSEIGDVTLKPLVRWRRPAHSPGTPRRLLRTAVPRLPLKYDVFHGRVQEVLIGQTPFVHGEGRSFAGFGRSHITTELVKETSVWLKDHQTGREHRFDLGSIDLPIRTGHDITFLWVNLRLYAIHNHSTAETRYFPFPPAVPPFRKVRFRRLGSVLWVLLGVLLFGFAVLPLLLGLSAYPVLAAVGQPDLWTAKILDPYIAMAQPPITAILIVLACGLMYLCNRRERAYNLSLGQELERQLADAMDRYVFANDRR